MNAKDQPDPILERYKRLTPEVLLTDLADRVRGRAFMLEQLYNLHSRKWDGGYLSHRLLREAVESFYCDVYRLKFFRPVEWVDSHKKAAYLMKWIARVRPIQIRSNYAQVTKATIMANAYFAVVAGFSFLEIERDLRTNQWWSRYVGNLVYLLHYHSMGVEQLCSEMCVLQTLNNTTQ